MLQNTYHYLLANIRTLVSLHCLLLDWAMVISVVEFIYQKLIDQVIRVILLKKLNANSSSCWLPILDRNGRERCFGSIQLSIYRQKREIGCVKIEGESRCIKNGRKLQTCTDFQRLMILDLKTQQWKGPNKARDMSSHNHANRKIIF